MSHPAVSPGQRPLIDSISPSPPVSFKGGWMRDSIDRLTYPSHQLINGKSRAWTHQAATIALLLKLRGCFSPWWHGMSFQQSYSRELAGVEETSLKTQKLMHPLFLWVSQLQGYNYVLLPGCAPSCVHVHVSLVLNMYLVHSRYSMKLWEIGLGWFGWSCCNSHWCRKELSQRQEDFPGEEEKW